jgi:hypothetical protein
VLDFKRPDPPQSHPGLLADVMRGVRFADGIKEIAREGFHNVHLIW